MANIVIKTPRGQIIQTDSANGKIVAKLEWNQNFGPTMTENYDNAQKFVDSEVLRVSDGYIPKRTGALIASGILGTEMGSGTVQWIVPYAQRQYYENRGNGKRGKMWFERAMIDHRERILEGAAKIVKGGYL